MIQVTSIRVEISNHPSKMSFTKEHRKHKRAAVYIHNFTTFSAEESSYEWAVLLGLVRGGWGGWVVGKSDCKENPVISLDLDLDLDFGIRLRVCQYYQAHIAWFASPRGYGNWFPNSKWSYITKFIWLNLLLQDVEFVISSYQEEKKAKFYWLYT